jgi:peptide-methionine (S)-S-oxide reductase
MIFDGKHYRRLGPWAVLTVLVTSGLMTLNASLSSADGARPIPAPAQDESSNPGATSEIAVLAGGCFWGVQGVFQHVEGVANAVSGYAGGDSRAAHYDLVSTGTTGHAESVEITFDPRRISYGRILQIFFSVAHDPTELNRQGPDVGTQYRSAIFPMSREQQRVAEAYIAQLNQAHAFGQSIVTTIETGKAFFPAEDHHQDFMARNPHHRYIVVNDLPKVKNLQRLFPALYRTEPVLVSSAPPAG